MKLGAAGAGLAAWVGAGLSSLCCLLPLAIITLGLGSGAFMAVTMKYRWIFIPAGILGVTAGFVLYVRERRRCDAMACRMAGSRVTLALLIVAGLVVTASVMLDRFPEFTADLLAKVMDRNAALGRHGRDAMRRWSMPWFLVFLVVLLLVDGAQAASTVTLSVEGMT